MDVAEARWVVFEDVGVATRVVLYEVAALANDDAALAYDDDVEETGGS